MPKSKITDEEWKIVRQASEAGVDDDALCMDYGLTKTAIKTRRSREKWLTPHRIQAEIAAQEARKSALNPMKNTDSATVATTKTAAEIVAAQVMEILERTGLRAAQMADTAFRDGSGEAPKIKTPNDVLTYLKIARLAAGADGNESTKPSVTINLGSLLNQPAETRPVIDV